MRHPRHLELIVCARVPTTAVHSPDEVHAGCVDVEVVEIDEPVAKVSVDYFAEHNPVLADFERQLGAIYSFDDDETWAAANTAAKQAVEDAQAVIAERCRELGIPKQFAPNIHMAWYGRGENAVGARRTELRRMATTRIAALEKAARTAIESHSVEAQTELIAGGLTSEAAKLFLTNMPSAETLMPKLDATEIKGLLGHGSPT